jgi:hypothetical protein
MRQPPERFTAIGQALDKHDRVARLAQVEPAFDQKAADPARGGALEAWILPRRAP